MLKKNEHLVSAAQTPSRIAVYCRDDRHGQQCDGCPQGGVFAEFTDTVVHSHQNAACVTTPNDKLNPRLSSKWIHCVSIKMGLRAGQGEKGSALM